jgi:phospholipid/cholesterol/gamma-HCH transport system substrate-binding protein
MRAIAPAQNTPDPVVRRARRFDHEVKVGLFVILGVVAVLTSLFTMTDAAMFRRRYIVRTLVPDAGGIRHGDPVLMRGVNVGRVQKFTIDRENVEVRLEIEGEYPMPVDSKVQLLANGIFGGMVAEIVPGNSEEHAGNGQVLAGERVPGLSDSATRIADSSQVVMKRLEQAVNGQTIENVEHSSADLRELLKEMRSLTNDEHRELLALTQSLRQSASAIESVSKGGGIQRTAAHLETTAGEAERLSTSLNRSAASLEAVLSRVDRGEGTLGQLTKDGVLYEEIRKTTANLNALVEDIRKNPRRYVKLSLF